MENTKFKKIGRTLATLAMVAILLSSIVPVVAGVNDADQTLQIQNEQGDLLDISLDDVGAAHGHICPCVAAAFKASQTAFLAWDGVPARGDIEIVSAHPSDGHNETFEYIINSTEDVTADLPEGTDAVNLTPENYNYRFIEKSSGAMVVVSVNPDIFPDGFFELRKKCKTKVATPDEKSTFNLTKKELKERILDRPADEVFEVEIVDQTLQIHDEQGELLDISLEDVGAAHGHICPCVAVAFKASQTAFAVWCGTPARGDLKIVSAHPSDGHNETFEYIINSTEDVTVELPEGTDAVNLTPENYNYRFIEKSSGAMVAVSVKPDTFPDGFFELRKKCKTGVATPEERSAFKLAKKEIKKKILYLPADEVFEVEGGFIPTTDSDNDGVPDVWDREPATPAGRWVNSQGIGRMLGDMNGDGKLTSVDALMILQAAVGAT